MSNRILLSPHFYSHYYYSSYVLAVWVPHSPLCSCNEEKWWKECAVCRKCWEISAFPATWKLWQWTQFEEGCSRFTNSECLCCLHRWFLTLLVSLHFWLSRTISSLLLSPSRCLIFWHCRTQLRTCRWRIREKWEVSNPLPSTCQWGWSTSVWLWCCSDCSLFPNHTRCASMGRVPFGIWLRWSMGCECNTHICLSWKCPQICKGLLLRYPFLDYF